MCLPELKLQGCVGGRAAAEPGEPGQASRRAGAALRWLLTAASVFAALAAEAAPVRAQAAPTPTPTPAFGQCPPGMATGQPLFLVPEVAARDGKLRGSVMLGSEERWMTNRIPISAPTDQSRSQCFPQFIRYFRGLDTVQYVKNAQGVVEAVPYDPRPADGGYPLPQPGPTLRARVGNLVQLSFINQINAADFGDSIDRAEKKRGGGCDETSAGYPGGDKFPDCFHGSSTGNIHFHGSHTNPNTTGDNVFIEVRPSLREDNKPVVTPKRVEKWFDEFFRRCEQELGRGVLREWPRSWADLPKGWTDDQEELLKRYDRQQVKDYGPGVKQLWPVDAAQLRQNAWPQYYIGSFPYCFRLPEYTEEAAAAPAPTPARPTMGGEGTAEAGHDAVGMGHGNVAAASGSRLLMGQAPGTHWYHAHKHGSTAINVSNGMTGAFVIEGQYDDHLNRWYGEGWTRTQPVMIVNQLGVSPNLMRGSGSQQDKGPDFSVNGRLKPVVSMRPGEVQMWRLINTSGRAAMYFAGPPAGFAWRQLAQDGVQFSDKNYKGRSFTNITVASGNRVDLLVKAPDAPCTNPAGCVYPVIVKNMVDPSDLTGKNPAQPLTLLSVSVSGQPVDPKSNGAQFIPNAPHFPSFLKDIADDEIKATKTVVFGTTPPQNPPAQPAVHTIDHKQFDGEVGQVVLLNTAEEWKVVNETFGPKIAHPFHIHINPFQVTEVFDPNASVTVTYTDPKTGKPIIDPKTKQPLTAVVQQYVFDQNALYKSSNAAFQKQVRAKQCLLNPLGDPGSWKPCGPAFVNKDNIWWDVFPIPSGAKATDAAGNPINNPQTGKQVQVPGYFKMRSRFVDFPGFYVIHCHILAHEDRGMMTIVEVAPARTPYSHH